MRRFLVTELPRSEALVRFIYVETSRYEASSTFAGGAMCPLGVELQRVTSLALQMEAHSYPYSAGTPSVELNVFTDLNQLFECWFPLQLGRQSLTTKDSNNTFHTDPWQQRVFSQAWEASETGTSSALHRSLARAQQPIFTTTAARDSTALKENTPGRPNSPSSPLNVIKQLHLKSMLEWRQGERRERKENVLEIYCTTSTLILLVTCTYVAPTFMLRGF